MSLIDDIKRDREAGTQGAFSKTSDHDWDIDTGGENAFYVIKGRDGPFAIVAVEQAFGMDDRNDADMRRVCRVPAMEAALLAAETLAEASEELHRAAQEVSRRGAEVGPQWTKLTVASLRHKSALTAYREALK